MAIALSHELPVASSVQSLGFKAMAGSFTRYPARTRERCTRYRKAAAATVHRVVRGIVAAKGFRGSLHAIVSKGGCAPKG